MPEMRTRMGWQSQEASTLREMSESILEQAKAQEGGMTAKRTIDFDERSHRYTVAGSEFLSVTKAIDAVGLISDWAKDEAAAERGTAVHLATRLHDEKNESLLRVHLRETAEMETEGYLLGWRSFLSQTGFKVRLIEHRVHDRINGYAGTLDRTGIFRGQEAVADIKSNKSGQVSPTVAMQTAAYANAYKPGRRLLRIAVALKPDGTFRCAVYKPKSLRRDLDDFLAVLRVAGLRRKYKLSEFGQGD